MLSAIIYLRLEGAGATDKASTKGPDTAVATCPRRRTCDPRDTGNLAGDSEKFCCRRRGKAPNVALHDDNSKSAERY